jgi:hypothetical protein
MKVDDVDGGERIVDNDFHNTSRGIRLERSERRVTGGGHGQ